MEKLIGSFSDELFAKPKTFKHHNLLIGLKENTWCDLCRKNTRCLRITKHHKTQEVLKFCKDCISEIFENGR